MPRIPTKFVEEPQALLCPVCHSIFKEPVISIKCGHTFCRRCIEGMVRGGIPCPLDEIDCDAGQLVLNRAVIGQVDDLLIFCCHGLVSRDGGQTYQTDPNGCKEVIKFGQRQSHEDICKYARVVCPVGGDECGFLRRLELEEHLLQCPRVPCPFADFGCSTRGTKEAIQEHKLQCVYRDESQLLAITMRELKIAKNSNEELRQSLFKVTKSVEKLTTEKMTMTSQIEQQALTITTLTSRMDRLESELEAFKSVRLRKQGTTTASAYPPSPMTTVEGGGTPSYHRKSYAESKRWSVDSVTSVTSLSVLPEVHRGPFVWQMPFTLKCIGTFRGHKGTIWSLVTHGDRLYSSSSDGTIKEWDIADVRRGCLKTVAAHKEAVMLLAVGRGILYSSGTDLTLCSWQIDTLDQIAKVEKAHDGIIAAMVYTKENLVTASIASIKFWDPLTLSAVHSISSQHGLSSHWVRALAYCKRRNLLYSASHNKIHVWKAREDFALVNQLSTSYGAIYSLTLTKRFIVTGTHNQNIQVYESSSLNHVASLTGHIGIVTQLCASESQHGVYMFSASSDSTVQVWNLENMLPIQALQRHERAVHSMVVWHDTVFTGSEDMEIKVFKHFKL